MPSDRLPAKFPSFDNVEDERRHRKQRLAAAFRLFGQFGFDEGVAGHITARDPELLDHFWVNPLGMNFKQIRVKDLILVNDRGEVVDGNWPVNAAAFAIHSQIHAARPDVVAAAHSHSVHGKAWSSLRRPLDPMTQDSCAFYGDHAVFDDYTGVVLDLEEGKRIAHALGGQQGRHPVEPRAADRRADVGRRGGVVVHHDGAHVPGAAAGGGRGHACPHRSRPGGEDGPAGRPTDVGGWLSFQPLYEWIVVESSPTCSTEIRRTLSAQCRQPSDRHHRLRRCVLVSMSRSNGCHGTRS